MTTVPITTQDRVPITLPYTARPTPASGSLTLNDVMRVLKQRMFLIIFVFVLATGATAGLTHWLIRNYPSYRASSAILVESPFPRKPMEFGESHFQVDLMNRFVADQMFLVRNESVLQMALADADIKTIPWYTSEPDKEKLLRELKDDLVVGQSPNSSFFVVSFDTRTKSDAPKIVNTIVKHYLSTVQASSLQSYSDELGEYRKRQAELKRMLQQIREQKEAFITSQFAVPGLTAGLNVPGDMWRALATEAARLEMEQLQLKAAFENLQGLDPSAVALSPQMMLMIDQDPQIAGLKGGLLALRQQRMSLLQRVGPNHQDVQGTDAQIEAQQSLLDGLIAEKQDQARQYQVGAAEVSWLNVWQAQLKLMERVEQAKAEQRDADRKLAQYQTLEEDQKMLEEQYTQITDYINQLELVVRDRQMVQVRQASQAVEPLQRHSPRWGVNMPIGAFLGLLVGVGLAVLLEVVDTSIRTSRDVLRHVHIPVLGTVPDLDDEELTIDKIELAAHSAPRSMIAEAFRTIRTNLMLTSPAERQRALLVTSAKPEEGKTAVAVNLAISIAQNNRRVLLIDANFHRPALKNLFPNIPNDGLSSILVGQKKLEQVVTSTNLPNLDVLGSGPIPPNPAELLASSYMQELITLATDRYDQVIFDGPPALLVSDALVVAGVLDGVILVCRAKSTSRGVVQRAREQIERANIRIFGAVLNAAQVTRGGYFREQIRTYYDYQPAESLYASAPPALPDSKSDNRPG